MCVFVIFFCFVLFFCSNWNYFSVPKTSCRPHSLLTSYFSIVLAFVVGKTIFRSVSQWGELENQMIHEWIVLMKGFVLVNQMMFHKSDWATVSQTYMSPKCKVLCLFSCFSLKEKRNKSSHLLVWHGQYPCMDDRCNDCKTIPSGLWNLTTSNGARPRLQERTAAVWDDTPACSSLHPALRDNCAFISGWKFNALHIHCIVHCVSHSWFSCFYCHTCYLQSCNNKRQFCFHSRQILLEGATHFVAL